MSSFRPLAVSTFDDLRLIFLFVFWCQVLIWDTSLVFIGSEMVFKVIERVTNIHQQIDLVSGHQKRFEGFPEISTFWRHLVDFGCHFGGFLIWEEKHQKMPTRNGAWTKHEIITGSLCEKEVPWEVKKRFLHYTLLELERFGRSRFLFLKMKSQKASQIDPQWTT